METGDGLLVRIPVKSGRAKADVVRALAALSQKYGNGHLDLSARGNLQLRGVRAETYGLLRVELAGLGFKQDFALNIIASPLAGIDHGCAVNTQEIAEKIESLWENCGNPELPEKFLTVVDGGGIFPLSSIPADLYFPVGDMPVEAGIRQILHTLKNSNKCGKKPADINTPPPPLGFIALSRQSGIVSISPAFGRIEADGLMKLADISGKFSSEKIIFAPFRRVILPDIAAQNSQAVLQAAADAGFIVKAGDSLLNIHACVGAPACGSAYGATRPLAYKWAELFPNLTQTVHITGCSKGCAYRGKADITITAHKTGYDITL